MKKVVVLTVRLDEATGEIIHALARAEDRSIAWVARALLLEALDSRKGLQPQDGKQHRTIKS